MKHPQYKGSPTLDEMLKRFELDPKNFKLDVASVEKIEAELKALREEYDKGVEEFELFERQRPSPTPYLVDFIDMGPDWTSRKVTPEKIKWHLDKGLTVEQIAEKFKRSVKKIETTFSKIGQIPVEEPIKEVPYGWKLTKDKYLPDETEQWIIKKIEDDHAAGKKFDDIAKELMKVGIKPRGGGLWFMRRLTTALKENDRMWSDYKARKILLFKKGRLEAGLSQ